MVLPGGVSIGNLQERLEMATIESGVTLKGSFEPLVKGFTDKTERGILRGSLRRTARQVLVKGARSNLRAAGGGRFAKDITVKTKVTNKVAWATVGAKAGSVLAKVGHLIERGTRGHAMRAKNARAMVTKDGIFIGSRANHPGTQAKPWLNPALSDNKGKAVLVFGQNLVLEIEKAVAKGKR